MTLGDYLVKSLTAHSLDLPPQAAKVCLLAARHLGLLCCLHGIHQSYIQALCGTVGMLGLPTSLKAYRVLKTSSMLKQSHFCDPIVLAWCSGGSSSVRGQWASSGRD